MSAGMGAILPLRMWEVSFVAGGRTIIDRVSVDLVGGPSTIVLGANGAGKSVLMRLMHGLLAPTSGEMAWLGGNSMRARRLPGERDALAREALESVGLWHLAHRPARVLSGGEQQRLALARAWALHPEVLFLDEPTASLDPGATREIEAVIRAFDAAGTKIVMATHNLGQARRLGDEVLFMHEGRIVERSPIAQFFARPDSAEAAAFIKGETPWA